MAKLLNTEGLDKEEDRVMLVSMKRDVAYYAQAMVLLMRECGCAVLSENKMEFVKQQCNSCVIQLPAQEKTEIEEEIVGEVLNANC